MLALWRSCNVAAADSMLRFRDAEVAVQPLADVFVNNALFIKSVSNLTNTIFAF
jgi:hypothetical protein